MSLTKNYSAKSERTCVWSSSKRGGLPHKQCIFLLTKEFKSAFLRLEPIGSIISAKRWSPSNGVLRESALKQRIHSVCRDLYPPDVCMNDIICGKRSRNRFVMKPVPMKRSYTFLNDDTLQIVGLNQPWGRTAPQEQLWLLETLTTPCFLHTVQGFKSVSIPSKCRAACVLHRKNHLLIQVFLRGQHFVTVDMVSGKQQYDKIGQCQDAWMSQPPKLSADYFRLKS